MGNNNFNGSNSTLTKIALEKKAFIGTLAKKNIPLISGYARNINKHLIQPIKNKGFFRGVGHYIKDQFTIPSYSKGLINKAQGYGAELNALRQLPIDKKTPEVLAKIKKLTESTKGLISRSKEFASPWQKMQELAKTPFNPDATIRGSAKAYGDLARMGGHYATSAIGPALMAGFPAYSLYQATQAPEGQRANAVAKSLGETAGFLATGPLGILPSIAGSMLGSHLGGKVAPLKNPVPSEAGMVASNPEYSDYSASGVTAMPDYTNYTNYGYY